MLSDPSNFFPALTKWVQDRLSAAKTPYAKTASAQNFAGQATKGTPANATRAQQAVKVVSNANAQWSQLRKQAAIRELERLTSSVHVMALYSNGGGGAGNAAEIARQLTSAVLNYTQLSAGQGDSPNTAPVAVVNDGVLISATVLLKQLALLVAQGSAGPVDQSEFDRAAQGAAAALDQAAGKGGGQTVKTPPTNPIVNIFG